MINAIHLCKRNKETICIVHTSSISLIQRSMPSNDQRFVMSYTSTTPYTHANLLYSYPSVLCINSCTQTATEKLYKFIKLLPSYIDLLMFRKPQLHSSKRFTILFYRPMERFYTGQALNCMLIGTQNMQIIDTTQKFNSK